MKILPSLEGMKAMRSTWTDSRLDDLNGRVGGVTDEVRELRRDVRDLRGEFGALQRTMMQVGGGLVGTLVVGMLGLIATQL
jgi:hypothetical protein